jgi:hypothetical protein
MSFSFFFKFLGHCHQIDWVFFLFLRHHIVTQTTHPPTDHPLKSGLRRLPRMGSRADRRFWTDTTHRHVGAPPAFLAVAPCSDQVAYLLFPFQGSWSAYSTLGLLLFLQRSISLCGILLFLYNLLQRTVFPWCVGRLTLYFTILDSVLFGGSLISVHLFNKHPCVSKHPFVRAPSVYFFSVLLESIVAAFVFTGFAV